MDQFILFCFGLRKRFPCCWQPIEVSWRIFLGNNISTIYLPCFYHNIHTHINQESYGFFPLGIRHSYWQWPFNSLIYPLKWWFLTIVFFVNVYQAGIQTSLRPKDHRLNFPMDRYFASGIHMTSSQSLGICGDEKNGISIFKENKYIYIYLVGGLEHEFYVSRCWESSQVTNSYFFRGVETTNQIYILYKQGYINHKVYQ